MEFMSYLEKKDKASAEKYIISILNEGKIDILNLYRNILSPSLNNMFCNLDEKELYLYGQIYR